MELFLSFLFKNWWLLFPVWRVCSCFLRPQMVYLPVNHFFPNRSTQKNETISSLWYSVGCYGGSMVAYEDLVYDGRTIVGNDNNRTTTMGLDRWCDAVVQSHMFRMLLFDEIGIRFVDVQRLPGRNSTIGTRYSDRRSRSKTTWFWYNNLGS